MRIRATFINRSYDPTHIELVHAWDEFSIDDNPEGYEADLAEDLATYQPDVLKVVTVDIAIPYSALDKLFQIPVIQGGLVAVEEQ